MWILWGNYVLKSCENNPESLKEMKKIVLQDGMG